MELLFSCRNCIHNPANSLNAGPEMGFCLQFNSLIWHPDRTTCKYLHRKDLPFFVVVEGINEHQAEFAHLPGMADLENRAPVRHSRYREEVAWERRTFDPIIHSVALYHRTEAGNQWDEPVWRYIAAFAGGVDGRRALAHAALVRRYMQNCGTWTSSYRLVLELLQDFDVRPRFESRALAIDTPSDVAEVEEQALWDVVFTRISGLQEYGWHSGIEELRWATDALNGSLSALDWGMLQPALTELRSTWTELVISRARAEGVFFPTAGAAEPNAVGAE